MHAYLYPLKRVSARFLARGNKALTYLAVMHSYLTPWCYVYTTLNEV